MIKKLLLKMQQSNAPFQTLTEKTTVKLPIVSWLAICVFCFSVGGLWISVKGDIDNLKLKFEQEQSVREGTDREIKANVERLLKEMQDEQMKQRDLLIRVDERIKKISP